MSNILVQADTLKALAAEQLVAGGLPVESAEIVADVLVHADSRGIHSHGVMRVEHYCKRLAAGGLNPNANITLDQRTPVITIMDSDNGMGHVACKKATEHAIETAKTQGISMVMVNKTSHCGALSYYTEMAAKNDMVAIAMTQTDKCVVPYGGAEPFFGTNPISFSFPSADSEPVIVDMATSNAAFGKILHARENNLEIPDNWAVDAEGNAITDPTKFAALLPFGAGAKGYCIALAIDALTGVLMGAKYGPHITRMYDEYDKMRNLVSMIIVINPEFFGGIEVFKLLMKQMSGELHASKPQPGFERVMVPGEPEMLNAQRSKTSGVPVAKSVYESLTKNAMAQA